MFRFFVKPQQLNNNTVAFDKDQNKKLRKVLRMSVGDLIKVFDGKGWEYEVQIEKMANDYSVAKVINQKLHEKDTNITLVQALPKNLKIEFIIQKCTELGIDHIIFFASKYSQIKGSNISEEKIKRWRKIAHEASEQCGRIFVPHVEMYSEDLQDLLNEEVLKSNKENTLYLDPKGNWLTKLKSENLDLKNVVIFVGPEGGFSKEETTIFEKNKIKKVKIATSVLRSETAAMTFLSQVQLVLNS